MAICYAKVDWKTVKVLSLGTQRRTPDGDSIQVIHDAKQRYLEAGQFQTEHDGCSQRCKIVIKRECEKEEEIQN